MVHAWEYNAGFLLLAGIAVFALAIFFWAMPETRDSKCRPLSELSGSRPNNVTATYPLYLVEETL